MRLLDVSLPPAAVCQTAGGEGRDPRHPGGPHQAPAGPGADSERADQGAKAQVGRKEAAAAPYLFSFMTLSGPSSYFFLFAFSGISSLRTLFHQRRKTKSSTGPTLMKTMSTGR